MVQQRTLTSPTILFPAKSAEEGLQGGWQYCFISVKRMSVVAMVTQFVKKYNIKHISEQNIQLLHNLLMMM